MKRTILRASVLVAIILTTISCKKTYQCNGKDSEGDHVFTCKNCKNDDLNSYQAQIEEQGYTEVSCTKK